MAVTTFQETVGEAAVVEGFRDHLPADFWDLVKKYPRAAAALVSYLHEHASRKQLRDLKKIPRHAWEKIFAAVKDDQHAKITAQGFTADSTTLKVIETILESVGIYAGLAVVAAGCVLAIIAAAPEIAAGVAVTCAIMMISSCVVAGCGEILALIHIWA